MASLITENNRISNVSGQSGVSRRKVMIAAVLVAVMGLMWAKVLFADKVGPDNASASTDEGINGGSSEGSASVTIEYTKLPVVVGRHDLLMNDMFGIKEWCDVRVVEVVEPDVEPTKHVDGDPMSQEQLDKLVENIKLEMILVGENGKDTEVIINEKMMKVGSKFKVENTSGTYVLEIIELSKNEVVVECEGIASAISMSEKNGITN